MQIMHDDKRIDELLSNPTPQSRRPSHQFSTNICLAFVSENKLMRLSTIWQWNLRSNEFFLILTAVLHPNATYTKLEETEYVP